MECLRCGWSEPLNDFPISWDWHRYYCYLFGKPDPGPCEPPEHPELKAIEQRLERIEQTLAGMSSEEFRQLKLKHIYDEVQDIRQGFRRIDQIVAQSIRKRQPARTLIEQPRGFMVLEMWLLPDGQVVGELTAVDSEKGRNVSIGLDQKVLARIMYQFRGLRALWRRQHYREAARARKREIGEE
jgi:hypothetical protein